MTLTLSEWAEASWWGTFVRESTWGFAIASIFLLFGIALLLGGVVLLSLRLLGLTMREVPVSRVARDVRGWTVIGLVATLLSGPSMWAATAMRYYDSTAFWLEMQLLAVAMLFHFTMFDWVTRRDDASPLLRGLTAVLALALWFGVGVAGRAIGFY
jgi:hypothetical protein